MHQVPSNFQTVDYVPTTHPVTRSVPVSETVNVQGTGFRKRRVKERVPVVKYKTRRYKVWERVPVTRQVRQTRHVPVTDYETRYDPVVVNHEVQHVTYCHTEPVVTNSYVVGPAVPHAPVPVAPVAVGPQSACAQGVCTGPVHVTETCHATESCYGPSHTYSYSY